MTELVYVPEIKTDHMGTDEYNFLCAGGTSDKLCVSVNPLTFNEGLMTIIASEGEAGAVCLALNLPRVEALAKVLTESAEKMRAQLKTEDKE